MHVTLKSQRPLRATARKVNGASFIMPIRRTWAELRDSVEYRGRWVALDNVTLDREKRPLEGIVVDCDDNLAALCARMRRADKQHCAIAFCDDEPPPSSVRAPHVGSASERRVPPVRLH